MKCPKCNGKCRVTDTVQDRENNETLRERKCTECGHKFYTAETEVQRDEYFFFAWYANHRGG